MRRNIHTFFAISILCTLILCSACTSGSGKPENAQSSENVGLAQVPAETESTSISFEAAKDRLEKYNTEKLPVYYILSRDVDTDGAASSWLFGVQKANETCLFILDRSGWKVNTLNAMLPDQEIALKDVISPRDLFDRNRAALIGAASSGTEYRDLALEQGIYTLTIRSGNSSRTLMFNATTGSPVS